MTYFPRTEPGPLVLGKFARRPAPAPSTLGRSIYDRVFGRPWTPPENEFFPPEPAPAADPYADSPVFIWLPNGPVPQGTWAYLGAAKGATLA